MNTPNDPPKPKRPSLLKRWRRRAYRLISNDTEQAWHTLLEENQSPNALPLTEQEREMVSAALQLDTLVADEMAIPRSDIVSIKLNSSFQQVLQTFQTSRKARLLVIDENLDDVRGFLPLKDIIPYVGREADFNLATLVRPATFIPENLSADKVLQRMKKQRAALAVVTDEYGGTTGLLTLKDILEELVGDLDDEDAVSVPTGPQPLGNGNYALDPKMDISDFRTFFSLPEPLEEESFETVSGLLFELAGRVPAKGEVLTTPDDLTFTITEADGRRVKGLTVKKG